MKKAIALLAMQNSRPLGEGRAICCTIAGAATSSVSPAHSFSSVGAGSSSRHLMATEEAHQKLAT